ncbi:MAG: prolyl oligopeptidase family serine peptidase, partial [Kofleriaceae bacterium]|nr:prolyl oligopeptidase family serine peptidase [Kofleriaceae bacterium]
AQGGGAGDYGDYYNYFADETMGYQDGLPGVFSVRETHSGPQYLEMRNRDTIVKPDGSRGVETHWFGYLADPENGEGKHAYPYTEARLLWMIPWTIEHYEVDPERVYCTGGSMGAWGSMSFAFRHPELFAAVYPNRPRFYQRSLATIVDSVADVDTLPDGLQWQTHHDTVAFVRQHPEDLPFLGWNVGRNDGFATWQEQIDMVTALEAGHHGFAFAWNNGDHSSGTNSDAGIHLWYPQDKFAKNLSYPAFANSSINNNLGNGDPTNGELEGGINLGFDWTVEGDTQTEWILLLRNDLAELAMTVDITPRRLQSFSLTAGESISYEVS